MAEALASVIEGASVSVKTMADGTLRLAIDIEPVNAQAAFMLFGSPGRAVALAALKDGAKSLSDKAGDGGAPPGVEAVVDHARASTPVVDHKPKGGEWAKLAGIWCAAPEFWDFLNRLFPNDSVVANADHAAMAVRVHCDISSRAELDHDRMAFHMFDARIRRPFMAYMQKRGIVLGRAA